jgi:ribosomal protein L16/L10AE
VKSELQLLWQLRQPGKLKPTGGNVPKPLEYVVDEKGKPTKVLLDIEEYEKLLEAAEDAEDLRALNEARARAGELIPLRQAITEIENNKL